MAATTVVFEALEFPPGRRSHHAHQFALRYKLGDRLYPDYGVTRYRAVSECGGTHDDVDPPASLSSTGTALVSRPSLFQSVARACVRGQNVYVCRENTPQGLAARSRNNYPEGPAFIRNYTMCRVYHCDLR